MRGGAAFPVRLRFQELGKVAWISHRDAARAFERAFRILELPIAFTEGFSPRPKVSFGLALSVGMSSVAEYLDVVFTTEVDLDALPAACSDALPEGLDVTGAALLADRAPALQESVTEVAYRAAVLDGGAPVDAEELRAAITAALARPTLDAPRTRKGRTVVENLAPAVRDCSVVRDDTDQPVLVLACATQPLSVRPSEVLAAVAPQWQLGHVQRTHQWIERAGMRYEPLIADAPNDAAQVCAS
ncbi:MAG: TIGR03936 family radical SAM-associated protein [Acidimicrobiia bacterium]